ncbi:hypothetical protein B0T22DRAFT_413389 [Podospora appendiculata]|uniref:Uncharacterized protein n=1 Tax=Podospora appendiculata TaxID=314037 RepID=A0AAE0X0W9_9PEZI|nr:hypothetical protein B0T22DRAFT_413389 [Podospora appendiculata]
MAQDLARAEPTKISVEAGLIGPHLDAFIRATSNVLATKIAEETYAQIVDGLPLAHVVQDGANEELPRNHPIYDHHKELCPGVEDKLREIRQNMDLGSLQLEADLVGAYRASSPGSRAFKTRLIEMTAVAVHAIAVYLFKLGTSLHTEDGIGIWVPSKHEDDVLFWRFNPEGAWPTLFRHAWYVNHERYPDGVADMVGYWAEARILGGVVLFDRRDPESSPKVQPDSVWLHGDREAVTYRIYRLLDDQKQNLLAFLTSETPDLAFLPILGDENNTTREDPEEPVENTGIYRNPWERKPRSEDDGDARLRTCWDKFDYPTWADNQRAWARAKGMEWDSSD